nr:MAG: hypothetical protein BECKFM1743C_GA0114222_1007114 [Candidatus Kentron sp. FM]
MPFVVITLPSVGTVHLIPQQKDTPNTNFCIRLKWVNYFLWGASVPAMCLGDVIGKLLRFKIHPHQVGMGDSKE